MFRQIWIHPDDRSFQTILWKPKPNGPIKTFLVNTVTYGSACASFLATLVEEIKESEPCYFLSVPENHVIKFFKVNVIFY